MGVSPKFLLRIGYGREIQDTFLFRPVSQICLLQIAYNYWIGRRQPGIQTISFWRHRYKSFFKILTHEGLFVVLQRLCWFYKKNIIYFSLSYIARNIRISRMRESDPKTSESGHTPIRQYGSSVKRFRLSSLVSGQKCLWLYKIPGPHENSRDHIYSNPLLTRCTWTRLLEYHPHTIHVITLPSIKLPTQFTRHFRLGTCVLSTQGCRCISCDFSFPVCDFLLTWHPHNLCGISKGVFKSRSNIFLYSDLLMHLD